MDIQSSTRDILLDLKLVIYNLIISYDAAYYHSIGLNVADTELYCSMLLR